MIRVTEHVWMAREIALDQIQAAARLGDRERMTYWIDRLVDRECELRGAQRDEQTPFTPVMDRPRLS